MRLRRSASLLGLLLLPTLMVHAVSFSTFVNGTAISNTESGNQATIGFAYAGNKFVGSVYFGNDNNQLYQTPLSGCPTSGSGCVTTFGNPISGASSELYVSASIGLGGFANGAVYVSNGPQGGLYDFSNDGTSQGVFTTTSSALNSDYVKGIAFDPYGEFGNAMLVSTNSGKIYSVTSGGAATQVFDSNGQVVEGMDFATSAWGAYAGDLVVASESAGGVYIIDSHGNSTFIGGITEAEEVGIVPLDLGQSGSPVEGFYAANYPIDVQFASASQFAGMLGDAVVSQEFGTNATFLDVHYNGGTGAGAFTVNPVAIGSIPNQAEDGIFVTQTLIQDQAGTPEPATLLLMGSGLLVIGRRLRRK